MSVLFIPDISLFYNNNPKPILSISLPSGLSQLVAEVGLSTTGVCRDPRYIVVYDNAIRKEIQECGRRSGDGKRSG